MWKMPAPRDVKPDQGADLPSHELGCTILHQHFDIFCMVGRKKSTNCSSLLLACKEGPNACTHPGAKPAFQGAEQWAALLCCTHASLNAAHQLREARQGCASLTNTVSSYVLIIFQIIEELAQHPVQQGL